MDVLVLQIQYVQLIRIQLVGKSHAQTAQQVLIIIVQDQAIVHPHAQYQILHHAHRRHLLHARQDIILMLALAQYVLQVLPAPLEAHHIRQVRHLLAPCQDGLVLETHVPTISMQPACHYIHRVLFKI